MPIPSPHQVSLPDVSRYDWVELQALREAARQRLLTHWVAADAFNLPRAITLARRMSEFLPKKIPRDDFHILELGAGCFNPHAMGMLFYLNRYPKITATDLAPLYAPSIAARWMYEAALHAVAFPEKWLLEGDNTSGGDIEQIRSRAYSLPLSALAEGKFESLREVPGQPFSYISLLEERAQHQPASYDYIYSNAVLEHIMDLPNELAWQYELLRPGGLCFALIGLEDHRYFDDPKTFSPWSFMLDGVYGSDQPIRADLRINGLRSSQIRQLVEKAGFSIEIWGEEPAYAVPADLAGKVRPEFKILPPDDLTTFRVKAVMKKQ